MAEKSTEFEAFLPTGGGVHEKVRGTIQEVLNRLQGENITAKRLIYWTDDGTNAEAFFSRRM